MREVRHTILRVIGDRYHIPEGMHRSWQGCNLDLTGVTIDGDLDFSGAVFSGGVVSFDRAVFSAGRVSFKHAAFSGLFSRGRVTITGGGRAYINGVVSGGGVSFNGAAFSGGGVSFAHATFSGGGVSFNGATFSGGTVDFRTARGPVPTGLLTAVNTPSAAGALLPSGWLSANP